MEKNGGTGSLVGRVERPGEATLEVEIEDGINVCVWTPKPTGERECFEVLTPDQARELGMLLIRAANRIGRA